MKKSFMVFVAQIMAYALACALFIATSVAACGCNQINAGKTIDVMEKIATISQNVCSSFDVFSAVIETSTGNESPTFLNTEKCNTVVSKIMSYKDSQQIKALYDVSDCVREFKDKKLQLIGCIDSVDGFSKVVSEFQNGEVFEIQNE